MSEAGPGRASQRRARRRAQVRQTALLLGLLVLVAVAFAVWLAFDAPEPPAASLGRAAARG